MTKFQQRRGCLTRACWEPVPNCSLGIRLVRPEKAHHDGPSGPPDLQERGKASMKMRRKTLALITCMHVAPQISANQNSQTPDPPTHRLPAKTSVGPLFSLFSAAPCLQLQEWALAHLKRVHVLRVHLDALLAKTVHISTTEPRGVLSMAACATRVE